ARFSPSHFVPLCRRARCWAAVAMRFLPQCRVDATTSSNVGSMGYGLIASPRLPAFMVQTVTLDGNRQSLAAAIGRLTARLNVQFGTTAECLPDPPATTT